MNNQNTFEVKKIDKNTIELVIHGTRTTLTVLLSRYLDEEKSVKFAGWKIIHPSFDSSSLVVKATDPIKSLKTVINKIVKECESLEGQIDKL